MTLETIEADCAKYVAQAIGQGATDAKVINASEVVVDERVTLKCEIPKCFGYGTCANCPPHTMKPDRTQRIVNQFRKAVVFKIDVPGAVIVRDKETIKERAGAYQTLANIVDAIESAAFYDGHYLAVGFAAGSCKSTFCYKAECSVLSGEKCRRSLKARPSMEAVGIDCYKIALKQGWDIFPIGSDADGASVEHGSLMGLLLVD